MPALENARRHRERRRCRERVRAGRVFVEHHTECEQIGANVHRFVVQLFGRHVRGRPDEGTRRGDAREIAAVVVSIDQRQTEVEDLQPARARAHHVFGLEIAVRDSPRVRRGKTGGQFTRGVDQFASRRANPAPDLLAQRVTVDVLRRNHHIVADLLERVDRADARMGERSRGARFAPQALTLRRVAHQVGWQHFQRDLATEPRVSGQIHASHAAAADLMLDDVGAERVVVLEPRRISQSRSPVR